MKINQWTRALLATGVVGFGAVTQAEEAPSSSLLTAVSGTQLSGFVSTSATWAPNSMQPAGGTGGIAFAPPTDGFNIDVIDLKVEKPLDEGEWSAGYAAELYFGPMASGLGNNVGSTSGNGGDVAIKQANIKLNAPIGNGLVLTMGVFDAIIGYEVANPGDNPNYTRNYAYNYEPFQHNGVLASYQICEMVSASVGMANESGTRLNSRGGGYSYMAAVTVTAPESMGPLAGTAVTAGVLDGSDAGNAYGLAGAAANAGYQQIYVGGTIPSPIENLSLGFAWDHFQVEGATDTDDVALYAGYKLSDKMSLNGRLEYLDRGAAAGSGAAGGEYLGTTLTLGYALWANVTTRAEWRWDKDLNGDKWLASGATPVAGSRNNNHLFALNVIYNF
jgi:hypothetical protein